MNSSPSTGALHLSASLADGDHRVGRGTAHGKAILFGEHAVVYGAPAIAIPVHSLTVEATALATPRGLRLESSLYTGPIDNAPVRLGPVVTAIRAAAAEAGWHGGATVRVRSSIPHERGLGSSAAVATAIIRAIFDLADSELDEDTLYNLIQTAERVAHGNPSGIDARSVSAAGTIRFTRGDVQPVRIGAPLTFVLADSGSPGSTAQAVGSVKALRELDAERTEKLLSRLAEIATGSQELLAAGDRTAIGASMTEAHSILSRVGVSSRKLDDLVEAALAAGAAGAKLTGGGLGGCVIAAANDAAHAEAMRAALKRAGATDCWTVEVPDA